FLALPCPHSFRVEWDLTGLVLRSCRIGATSSCRNWTRIPLGTENCRSLLSRSHARKGVSLEAGILPARPPLEVYHGRALYPWCRLGCPQKAAHRLSLGAGSYRPMCRRPDRDRDLWYDDHRAVRARGLADRGGDHPGGDGEDGRILASGV